ncbi:urease accessory protein [Sulfitobacter brevis]|uniref:Urease accessory protein UreF n=2 Tax=Sulfitobacter brevis TaxID=74348 RepID=A0A1I2D1P2_9RHOB|nr:urease accessory protein [Sulfitobacter brevis]
MVTGAHMDTIMATFTTMRTDQFLTLVQWLSPSYPIGAFAYSHGLEWAVDAQQVTDRETLQAWLETVLRHGAGRTDALFLCAAYRTEDVTDVDAHARAFAPSAERLRETVLQGEAFSRATRDIWNIDMPVMTYPVAVGFAARLHGLPLDQTMQVFLHGFISNLAAAGMRLIPLGQTDGQIVIKELAATCIEIADAAMKGSLEDLSSTAFLSDIASMRHETQYSRIFRT